MLAVNHNPSPSELRSFGGVMFVGLAVIGGAIWWLGRPEMDTAMMSGQRWLAIGLGLLGVLSLGVCLISPIAARPLYIGWMTFGMALGLVVTTILFTVLYWVLLPIFALIRFGDPLRLKLAPDRSSYWEDHGRHEATLQRTARPF